MRFNYKFQGIALTVVFRNCDTYQDSWHILNYCSLTCNQVKYIYYNACIQHGSQNSLLQGQGDNSLQSLTLGAVTYYTFL
jgi:hypothetical protein